MTTLLTATITTPNGTPIDAMQVVFTQPDGGTITTSTDAGGGITCNAVGEIALTVSQSIALDGTVYEAGTILRFDVPEEGEPQPLANVFVAADDASPAALLAQIAALTAQVADQDARIAALEGK